MINSTVLNNLSKKGLNFLLKSTTAPTAAGTQKRFVSF
jgi:hypothetical protein